MNKEINNRIREELIEDFNKMWHTADFRKPEKIIKESISKWWLSKIAELLKSQKESRKIDLQKLIDIECACDANDCDKLMQEIGKRKFPKSIISGLPTQVMHHREV